MIFVDTTEWVAAIDASDELHEDGKAVVEALVKGKLPLAVTTDFVLGETMTLLKKRGAKPNKIVETIQRILSSPRVNLLFVDAMLFKASLASFARYARLSFTDATTLTAMSHLKIREIYTHDTDFDMQGIVRKESP
ncbi:MAG: type II toxin-antitoxin system VapC family toxin [Thaumarchaeota archaeon]|nr:type II toxin-antitoxin system VapC family toxin [Nitrososphaerota archaeon]